MKGAIGLYLEVALQYHLQPIGNKCNQTNAMMKRLQEDRAEMLLKMLLPNEPSATAMIVCEQNERCLFLVLAKTWHNRKRLMGKFATILLKTFQLSNSSKII